MMSMIHEFTHVIQWYEKKQLGKDRPMSETETTRAVIDYVRENLPDVADQLEKFE